MLKRRRIIKENIYTCPHYFAGYIFFKAKFTFLVMGR